MNMMKFFQRRARVCICEVPRTRSELPFFAILAPIIFVHHYSGQNTLQGGCWFNSRRRALCLITFVKILPLDCHLSLER